MRRTAALAGVLMLAACGQERLPPIGASAQERSAPPIPISSTNPPTFVGRWATVESVCDSRAWVLQADRLQSPSAFGCNLVQVDPTSAGYSVSGMCSVGKAIQPVHLNFTLTDSARSLTLDGSPFAEPVGLVRCAA